MTDRPPDITGYSWGSDGALTVNWEVDSFFDDSSDPDNVSVEINALPYKEGIGADARDIDIPAADVKKLHLTSVTVVFEWNTGDMQRSSVNISVSGGIPVGFSNLPAPTLQITATQPKTIQNQNQITILVNGSDYTDGTILYGPVEGPNQTRISFGWQPGDKGGSPDYAKTYSAGPLTPNLLYFFEVQVVNKIQDSQKSASATLTARSANNYHSVRAFCTASGVRFPSGVRQAIGHGGSLRVEMGI